jgi:hypothetical protein
MAYYTDKTGQTRSNLPAVRPGRGLARPQAPLGDTHGPQRPEEPQGRLQARQFGALAKAKGISKLEAFSNASQRNVAFRSQGGWGQALRYTLGVSPINQQAGQMYKAEALRDITRRGAE